MNPVRTNVLHLEKLDLFITSTTFQKGQSIDFKFLSLIPNEDNYFYKNILFQGSFKCSYPGKTEEFDILNAGDIGPLSSKEGLKLPQVLNDLISNEKGVLDMRVVSQNDDAIYYCIKAREDKKVVDDIHYLSLNESITIPNLRFFFVFGKNYSIDENPKNKNGVFLSETKDILVKAIEPCKIVSFYSTPR